MAATVVVLATPLPTALAGDAQSSKTPDEAGLPFSTGDLGWLFLAAVVLLMLMLVLQLVIRRRRALRSMARERTDP